MLDIFSGLRLVVKRRSISIDNAIFRCHWFFTSTLLVSFSLVITARQYVGQPIECHSVNKISESLLNSYCWVQSTFSIPQACNQQVGVEVPYPCIDNTRGREIKMFAYYQWVGMVLFIQGLLFHLPYYLWKVWENGLIRAITGGLRVAVLNDQERTKKKNIVVDYIHEHLGCHKRYAFKYFLCEFICLVNLLIQLWATNKFFDGQFLRYGLNVMQYSSATLSSQFGLATVSPIAIEGHNSNPQAFTSNYTSSMATTTSSLLQNKATLPGASLAVTPELHKYAISSNTGTAIGASRSYHNKFQQPNQQQQIDPMTYIFPRMTKCTYYDFGSSGDIQKHDALCLLPLNIINEKIYIALWFWFLILAILTMLVIVYRIFAIVSENVRCKGLISRCKLSSERDIQIICRHCDVGDWFLFYMVAENLDPLIMREIIAAISDKIRAHFQLKRELGIDNTLASNDYDKNSLYKFHQSDRFRDTHPSFGLPINSPFATNNDVHQQQHLGPSCPPAGLDTHSNNSADDEASLVTRWRKRFSIRRLWSTDSAYDSLRQHLFGIQAPVNPELVRYQTGSGEQLTNRDERSNALLVSAPPLSELGLNSSAPTRQSMVDDDANTNPMSSNSNTAARLARRGSLTRTGSSSSSSSGVGSFVMEMQTISDSSSRFQDNNQSHHYKQHHLNRQDLSQEHQVSPLLESAKLDLRRRLSVQNRQPPSQMHMARPRHYRHHAHHQSIASISELRSSSLDGRPAPIAPVSVQCERKFGNISP